ncbi:MAG: hypothetical protein D6755_04020 [Anaerolineae bacterium]|nr:MAG: hypothetical protein D6755_04020 [Anaerolineae bacterium]
MKKVILAFTLLFLAVSISACSGSFAPTSWPGLAADENTAYVAYQNHVYAVDTSNGSLRWQYPQEASRSRTFFAAPVLTPNGELLVGDYASVLVSLNPENGQENWRFEAAARFVGSPLSTENAIYAPTADGALYALDLQGNPIWDTPFHSDKALWATPILDGDTLYVGSMDHTLYALNAADGSLIWKTQLDGALNSAPLLLNGRLYIGTFAQQVVALDAANGDILWTVDTDGWVWATPQALGERLFVGDVSGTFYAINLQDGSLDWRITPDGAITSNATIAQDTVYFTTESGSLYAVAPDDGSTRWTYQVQDAQLYGAPQVSGQSILIAPTAKDNTLLIALDLQTGTQRWSFTPEKK